MKGENFSELLLYFRCRAGMTQQQLADFSTVSTRTIRDLERGRAKCPRQDTVRLLADALRVDSTERSAFENSARRPTIDRTWLPRRPESLTALARRDDLSALAAARKFEYKTLLLCENGPSMGDWEDVLNRESEWGWRLVAVDKSTAFLERQITDAG